MLAMALSANQIPVKKIPHMRYVNSILWDWPQRRSPYYSEQRMLSINGSKINVTSMLSSANKILYPILYVCWWICAEIINCCCLFTLCFDIYFVTHLRLRSREDDPVKYVSCLNFHVLWTSGCYCTGQNIMWRAAPANERLDQSVKCGLAPCSRRQFQSLSLKCVK